MAEVKYVVKTKFKYGERVYMPGESFEPMGGRFDTSILRHHVRTVPVLDAEPLQEVKHAEKRIKGQVK